MSKGEQKATTRSRAKLPDWRLVLGLALIAAAILTTILRYKPRPAPSALTAVPPVPLRLPSDLEAATTVPATFSDFKGANLLLVTLDTTRADRIGCYGNQRIDTPNIDRLAREGVLFTDASAPGPVTLPSHSSIMTGRHPFHHGARVNALSRLDDEPRTLAEALSDQGYATGAFTSAFVLDAQFGVARGFDDYDCQVEDEPEFWVHVAERRGDQTCDRALQWLRAHAGNQFFLWLHLFDPHWPYNPPEPFASRYGYLPYDGEIAFADAQLGRVLELLDELDVYDNTLIVIAGDHGEALLQHDESTHGCLLHESTARTPMIMSCSKRLGGGKYIDQPVSLMDITPTVLTLLGVESPEGLDGVDLTEPVEQPRMLFAETLEGLAEYGWAALWSVREGSLKYIHGPDPELYDLSRDPYEENDLIDSNPADAARLRRRLFEFYGGDPAEMSEVQPTQEMSPAELAKLESLGYVFGSASQPEQAKRRNPKPMMKVMRRIMSAYSPDAEDWLNRAIAEVEDIANEYPDLYMAHLELGTAYAKASRFDEAETEFLRSLELRPRMIIPLQRLATLKDIQKDFDAAVVYYRELLRLFPGHFPSLARLGVILRDRGRLDESADLLQRAHEIVPANADVAKLAFGVLQTAGRVEDSIAVLKKAIAVNPEATGLRGKLARVCKSRGDFDAAEALLRAELKVDPDSLETAANLSIVLTAAPDRTGTSRAEAAAIMERVCGETEFRNPAYVFALGRAYAGAGRIDDAIETSEKALAIAREIGADQLVDAILRELELFRRRQMGVGDPQPDSAPAGGGDEPDASPPDDDH